MTAATVDAETGDGDVAVAVAVDAGTGEAAGDVVAADVRPAAPVSPPDPFPELLLQPVAAASTAKLRQSAAGPVMNPRPARRIVSVGWC